MFAWFTQPASPAAAFSSMPLPQANDTTMNKFTLCAEKWYACEFIGDHYADQEDRCSYSPIKIWQVVPHRKQTRVFSISFYHANFPLIFQNKMYDIQTIERAESYILTRTLDYSPPRFLQIYEISTLWLKSHFAEHTDSLQADADPIAWLEKYV